MWLAMNLPYLEGKLAILDHNTSQASLTIWKASDVEALVTSPKILDEMTRGVSSDHSRRRESQVRITDTTSPVLRVKGPSRLSTPSPNR